MADAKPILQECGQRWLTTPEELKWQAHFKSSLKTISVVDSRQGITHEKAGATLSLGKKWLPMANLSRRSNGLTAVLLRDRRVVDNDSGSDENEILLSQPDKVRIYAEVSLWHTNHAGFTPEAHLSLVPMVWDGKTMWTDSQGNERPTLKHQTSKVEVTEIPLECDEGRGVCITDRRGYLAKVSLSQSPGEIGRIISIALREVYAKSVNGETFKEVRQQITAAVDTSKRGMTRLEDVQFDPQGGEGWDNSRLPAQDSGPVFLFGV